MFSCPRAGTLGRRFHECPVFSEQSRSPFNLNCAVGKVCDTMAFFPMGRDVQRQGHVQHLSYSRWTLGEVLFRRFPWVLPCSPEQGPCGTVPMFPTDATTVWRSVNGTIHSSHHL
jgi:hypothetical protein